MPRYTYTAKPNPHKTIKATLEALSEQDALAKLGAMGYFPVSIELENPLLNQRQRWGFRKVSAKELALFTRQLATLLESGVNIINCFSILSAQIPNAYFKSILDDISLKIKDGASLSQGFSNHPELFSGLYISMVHAGEAGGQIETTLKRLADFLEKEVEFRNSVSSALLYPFFIVAVSVATIVILLAFVIPRLVGMFKDMGQVLPVPTQILIATSEFLRSYWWFLAALFLAAVFFKRRLAKSTQGRMAIDKLKLSFPVLGDITVKTQISRLMRTLSLLLGSGVPVVQALDVASSVLTNLLLQVEILGFKSRLSEGESLSQCVRGSRLFSDFVTSIVTTGEESGTLEKSLGRLADDYEKEVDRTLKNLTRLLEPVIILIMGLLVGFIVLSMLLPIFQLNVIVK